MLHAARAVDRPVKWHAARSENLLSDNHARDAVIECALALDAIGRFLGVRASILQSMGRYFGCNGPNGTIRNTPWGMPLVLPHTCLYRKLNFAIMVMKSAEDRHRCDATPVLDGAME